MSEVNFPPLVDYTSLPGSLHTSFRSVLEREDGIAQLFFLSAIDRLTHDKAEPYVLLVSLRAMYLCTLTADIILCVPLEEVVCIFVHNEFVGLKFAKNCTKQNSGCDMLLRLPSNKSVLQFSNILQRLRTKNEIQVRGDRSPYDLLHELDLHMNQGCMPPIPIDIVGWRALAQKYSVREREAILRNLTSDHAKRVQLWINSVGISLTSISPAKPSHISWNSNINRNDSENHQADNLLVRNVVPLPVSQDPLSAISESISKLDNMLTQRAALRFSANKETNIERNVFEYGQKTLHVSPQIRKGLTEDSVFNKNRLLLNDLNTNSGENEHTNSKQENHVPKAIVSDVDIHPAQSLTQVPLPHDSCIVEPLVKDGNPWYQHSTSTSGVHTNIPPRLRSSSQGMLETEHDSSKASFPRVQSVETSSAELNLRQADLSNSSNHRGPVAFCEYSSDQPKAPSLQSSGPSYFEQESNDKSVKIENRNKTSQISIGELRDQRLSLIWNELMAQRQLIEDLTGKIDLVIQHQQQIPSVTNEASVDVQRPMWQQNVDAVKTSDQELSEKEFYPKEAPHVYTFTKMRDTLETVGSKQSTESPSIADHIPEVSQISLNGSECNDTDDLTSFQKELLNRLRREALNRNSEAHGDKDLMMKTFLGDSQQKLSTRGRRPRNVPNEVSITESGHTACPEETKNITVNQLVETEEAKRFPLTQAQNLSTISNVISTVPKLHTSHSLMHRYRTNSESTTAYQKTVSSSRLRNVLGSNPVNNWSVPRFKRMTDSTGPSRGRRRRPDWVR